MHVIAALLVTEQNGGFIGVCLQVKQALNRPGIVGHAPTSP